MKRKRLLSLLLCAAMLCSLMGAPALADEETPAGTVETTSVGNDVERSNGDNAEGEAKGAEESKDPVASNSTGEPTGAPTDEPSEEPTGAPTDEPSEEPTGAPTGEPSEEPTDAPTGEPSAEPTDAPTEEPAEEPTSEPTEEPTGAPTEEPTGAPTEEPTGAPTEEPTSEPTEEPTAEPTEVPTEVGEPAMDEPMLLTMGLDEPMLLEAVTPAQISISVSGAVHGSYYCPGATLTVTSTVDLERVTIGNTVYSPSGKTFSHTITESGTYDVVAVAKDGAGRASDSFSFSHGDMKGSDAVSDIPATCTKPAYTFRHFRCAYCGAWSGGRESQVEGSTALGHDFDEEVTLQNASQCGATEEVKIRRCKREGCGYVEIVSGSFGEAATHDFEETIVPATCKVPGYKATICKKCGMIKPDTVFESLRVDTAAHKWSAWDPAPGTVPCGSDAKPVRTCEVCGTTDTYNEATAKIHSFTRWKVTTEGTCEIAKVEELYCEHCNTKDPQGQKRTTKAPGHKYELDPEQTKQASCTEAGQEVYRCTVCGQTKTETIAQLNHAPVAGHYESDGSQHWQVCANCGEVIGEKQGHTIVNSDCTKNETCSVCGYEVEGTASQHEWDFTTIEANTHGGSCKKCHMQVNAQPHNFEVTDSCTDPTRCTVCGYEKPGQSSHKIWGCWFDDGYRITAVRDAGDGLHHYRDCEHSRNCKQRVYFNHIPDTNGDCTKGPITCMSCGAVLCEQKPAHVFNTPSHVDNLQGTATCTNPGCTVTTKIDHRIEEEFVRGTPATCDTPGERVVRDFCLGGCGYTSEERVTVIPAKGHQWTEWETRTESTCTGSGEQQRSCEVCGTIETQNIDPANHGSGKMVILQEATCTTEGSQVLQCEKCGLAIADAETIPALGHEEKVTVSVAATCTADAVLSVTCSRCDLNETRPDVGSALGHSFTNYQYQGDATCQKNGTEKATCDRCGSVDSREKQGSKLEHVFTNDDDCTTPGECVYHCGATTPALTHVPSGSWLIDPDEGTHYKLCGNEGCTRVAVEERHTPADDDGDCTTPILCTVCGTVVSPANTAHSFTTWTDGKDGTHVSKCVYCDKTAVESHAFTAYAFNDDAWCEVNGSETATCDKCEATDTREVPGSALTHEVDVSVPAEIVDPTCTEPGYTVFNCSRCHEDFQANPVDALGHERSVEIPGVIIAPTCTADGYTVYTCARCGEEYRDDFTHAGHKPVGEGDKAATCTEDGYKGGTHCSVCGETLSARTAIPALGHSFGAWNASGGGSHTATCTRCGATKSESCGYSEVKIGATTVNVCKVCGDVIDPSGGETVTAGRFEVVEDAASEEIDPGAIPAGCELIVRKLDVPFQDADEVLEAFTLGCERNGVALPLQGRIRVTMPVSCPMPFRLIRVDVVGDAQTGESTEQMVEIEFTYESGRITFETDRDGMFLLTQLDEAVDAA